MADEPRCENWSEVTSVTHSIGRNPSRIERHPGRLYGALQPDVARISRTLMGTLPSQELIHDICVEVALSVANYRGDCSFSSWVYAVVSRRVHRWIRKENRYRSLLCEVRSNLLQQQPLQPDDASIEFEQMGYLREVLAALPERERQCLVLVRLESVSVQEAAKRLLISPEAVRMNVHRARAHLRKALDSISS